MVLAVYAPTLSYGFVYEDLNDPARFLDRSWAAWTDPQIARKLTKWSYMLSGLISPMEPWGYHLISVLLHALNTVLLFLLGRVLWSGLWLPFVCAALFALHPVQTEAVAYISARADVLMTTFVLLAVLAAERGRWAWMLVACLGAVLAKESGIVAVPLVVLWTGWRRLLVPAWIWGVVLVGGLGGALFLVQYYDLGAFSVTYTAQETAKLWHLLGKVVLPIGLSVDHDYTVWPSDWPMVTLLVTVGVGCVALTSQRPWAQGVLFVLVALAPRLLVPLVEGLHEHHIYAPLVGISLAVVGAFVKGEIDGISETSAQA